MIVEVPAVGGFIVELSVDEEIGVIVSFKVDCNPSSFEERFDASVSFTVVGFGVKITGLAVVFISTVGTNGRGECNIKLPIRAPLKTFPIVILTSLLKNNFNFHINFKLIAKYLSCFFD